MTTASIVAVSSVGSSSDRAGHGAGSRCGAGASSMQPQASTFIDIEPHDSVQQHSLVEAVPEAVRGGGAEPPPQTKANAPALSSG